MIGYVLSDRPVYGVIVISDSKEGDECTITVIAIFCQI